MQMNFRATAATIFSRVEYGNAMAFETFSRRFRTRHCSPVAGTGRRKRVNEAICRRASANADDAAFLGVLRHVVSCRLANRPLEFVLGHDVSHF